MPLELFTGEELAAVPHIYSLFWRTTNSKLVIITLVADVGFDNGMVK